MGCTLNTWVLPPAQAAVGHQGDAQAGPSAGPSYKGSGPGCLLQKLVNYQNYLRNCLSSLLFPCDLTKIGLEGAVAEAQLCLLSGLARRPATGRAPCPAGLGAPQVIAATAPRLQESPSACSCPAVRPPRRAEQAHEGPVRWGPVSARRQGGHGGASASIGCTSGQETSKFLPANPLSCWSTGLSGCKNTELGG